MRLAEARCPCLYRDRGNATPYRSPRGAPNQAVLSRGVA